METVAFLFCASSPKLPEARKVLKIIMIGRIPSIGVDLHQWNETTLSFKVKYLYKGHCKSYELLWAFKGYHII
jgi:hypothetical protein